MRQQRAGQVQFPIDLEAQPMLEMLSDNLAEQHLLGEILRSDGDRVFPCTAGDAG